MQGAMQGLFKGGNGNGGKGKKSTAQPRPKIRVAPRGIGPVRELNENDVLSGRGGRINAHKGNVQFRELVISRKKEYLAKTTKKLAKAHIAADIVHYIRDLNPSGRFLKEDADGAWYDIGDAKAIKKVGQALREDAPDIRTGLEKDHSSDDDNKASDEHADENANDKKPTPNTEPTVEENSKVRTGITVSGRGAKIVSASSPQKKQQPNEAYQPLAYQKIAPPPSYHPVVPATPPAKPQDARNGFGGATAGVSGAAAAVMGQDNNDHFQIPPERHDVAFGLPFHPPPARVDAQRETSLVSGLSASVMSGLSNFSGMSGPMSSLSASGNSNLRSVHQLQELRQQWAQQNQQVLVEASMTSSALTGTRHLLASNNSHLGSSLNRSNSLSDLNASMDNVSMANSMTEHSLMGGGIGAASLASGLSYGMQSVVPSREAYGAQEVRASSGGTSSRVPPPQRGWGWQPPAHQPAVATPSAQPHYGANPQAHYGSHENSSVAAMSVNSNAAESLPSRSGSVMSDLSESLIALDLAESSLLDQI